MANLIFLSTRSRSFRGQGHKCSHQLKGSVQTDCVTKYEENPLTNKEIMATVKFSSARSSSFRGQGHKCIHQGKGLVQTDLESNYEENPFTNKEVTAIVKHVMFDLQPLSVTLMAERNEKDGQ